MATVIGLGAHEAQRTLRLILALILLVAVVYGVAHVTHAARHEGRCQELLTSDSRSAYIGFEAEGCRAELRRPAAATVTPA